MIIVATNCDVNVEFQALDGAVGQNKWWPSIDASDQNVNKMCVSRVSSQFGHWGSRTCA